MFDLKFWQAIPEKNYYYHCIQKRFDHLGLRTCDFINQSRIIRKMGMD